jgi:hypothetical protein
LPLEAVVIVLVLLPNGNDVVDVVPQVLFILDVLLECVPANGAVEHLVGDPAHEAHLLGVFQARHELLSDFHKLVECDTCETANVKIALTEGNDINLWLVPLTMFHMTNTLTKNSTSTM